MTGLAGKRAGRRAGRRIVVVGGSLAGHAAVTALAARVPDCELVWITGADRRAYSKPALSKEFMQGHCEERDILLPAPDIGSARLTLLSSRLCIGLDTMKRCVVLDGDETLDFDGLIVCTGAEARMPALFGGIDGVLPLRTMDDAIAIRRRLAAKPKTLMIGGGLIGCELAASIRALGLEATIVEQLDALLSRPFGGALTDFLAELHRNNGVELLTGLAVERLVQRDGRIAEAQLSDGTAIKTQLVLVGAGSVPATAWLAGSGLALDDGVVCDEYLATSVAGIYAAGDVARWFNPCFGLRMRVEHWTNASAQGRAAAENLAADLTRRHCQARPFADVPYFWSDQFGHKIQMVGWHEGHDRQEIEQGGSGGPIVRYYRGERLVAAAGVNAPRTIMACRRQIGAEARARLPAAAGVA